MLSKYEPHFSGAEFDVFVDLFGGSGMMSYWIHRNFPDAKIVLNEINPCLYGVYNAIKTDYDEFKKQCIQYETKYLSLPGGIVKKKDLDVVDGVFVENHRAGFYFNLRGDFNERHKEFAGNGQEYPIISTVGAAQMFFLLKTCFNGIWQGSTKTRFSTPPGHCRETVLFDWDKIEDFRNMLIKADLLNGCFTKVPAYKNSLVYADPPYVSSYTRYDNDFGEHETRMLCDYLIAQADLGNQYAMSNKEHALFEEKFPEGVARIERFDVKYSASSKDTLNAKSVEVLITNIQNPTSVGFENSDFLANLMDKTMNKKVYVFTGAGLSAASGIPTFRSGDSAIWENYRLEDVCNFGNWKVNFDLVHDFYNERRAALADVHPNAAHKAIAAWQEEFGAENVISVTTNVDDLLERAGVKNTVHLHGKLKELYDTETEEVHDVGYEPYDKSCKEIKPNVIFFGEEAPEYKTLEKLIEQMTDEDVVIFIGMSFVVVPAMMMLPLDKQPMTVCVNPDYMSHYEHPFDTRIEKTAEDAIEDMHSIIKERLK